MAESEGTRALPKTLAVHMGLPMMEEERTKCVLNYITAVCTRLDDGARGTVMRLDDDTRVGAVCCMTHFNPGTAILVAVNTNFPAEPGAYRAYYDHRGLTPSWTWGAWLGRKWNDFYKNVEGLLICEGCCNPGRPCNVEHVFIVEQCTLTSVRAVCETDRDAWIEFTWRTPRVPTPGCKTFKEWERRVRQECALTVKMSPAVYGLYDRKTEPANETQS